MFTQATVHIVFPHFPCSAEVGKTNQQAFHTLFSKPAQRFVLK